MPDSMKLKEVAKEISKAKRPLLYTGGGVIHSGGSDELIKFAREHRIPVVSTLMGLGAYPPEIRYFRNAWYAWNVRCKYGCNRM